MSQNDMEISVQQSVCIALVRMERGNFKCAESMLRIYSGESSCKPIMPVDFHGCKFAMISCSTSDSAAESHLGALCAPGRWFSGWAGGTGKAAFLLGFQGLDSRVSTLNPYIGSCAHLGDGFQAGQAVQVELHGPGSHSCQGSFLGGPQGGAVQAGDVRLQLQ